MTHEDIERMAREAGMSEFSFCTESNLERFAALVRAQALEEAALMAEDRDDPWDQPGPCEVARLIRAMKG